MLYSRLIGIVDQTFPTMRLLCRAGCVAAFVVTAAVGCDDDRTIVDTFPATAAIVHGEISTPEGSGVEDATVRARGWRLGCPGEGGKGPLYEAETTSDALGSYTMRLEEQGLGPEEVCLVVEAAPDSDSQTTEADTGATVMTRLEPPLDSARVDLELPISQ